MDRGVEELICLWRQARDLAPTAGEEVPVIVRKRYRLTYPIGLLDRPILHTLIRRFDILTNIRSAKVSDSEGWLIVDLEGEEAEVEAGLAWAELQGLQVTMVEAAG